MMRKMRKLKVLLGWIVLDIRNEWIIYFANKFGDELSLRFPSGGLNIWRKMWSPIKDVMSPGIPLPVSSSR